MAHADKGPVGPPAEDLTFNHEHVASGSCASAGEVVRAGLRAPQGRDVAVERWLRAEVAPVFDAMQADPGRARSLDEVVSAIRAQHPSALADRR
jgi:antitoxin ParD1/3/4